ncbi:MAG: hypothetical protein K6L73_09125 [Cellvibrionaceae bacterium]
MAILVYYLDDEEALCDIFSSFFQSDVIEIVTFSESESAIKACVERPPSLFFIDYRLHGATGDDVAFSVSDEIPKILVTGDHAFTPKYHFQKVIPKPFDFKFIQGVLEERLASES